MIQAVAVLLFTVAGGGLVAGVMLLATCGRDPWRALFATNTLYLAYVSVISGMAVFQWHRMMPERQVLFTLLAAGAAVHLAVTWLLMIRAMRRDLPNDSENAGN